MNFHFPQRLKRLVISLISAILLLSAAIPATTLAAVEPPTTTAESVYSYDLETGIVLYEENANERRPIGSTTKVATALVVMEYGDPADEVLIEQEDTVDITLYSNMQLQAGDTLTVGTLLYGLLLPSGNDGAWALARHVGKQICNCDERDDAIDAFIGAMNEYVQELGLEDTRFVNPDGLDNDSAYSTAHDIAILFGELMQNEKLADIVAEPAYSFWSVGANSRNYSAQTTNQLLGQSGVIGGKTGTTSEAGACAVLAREMADGAATVITSILGADVRYDSNGYVVEGSDQRWNDARALFAAMDSQFTWVVPGEEGTFPGLDDELAVWQVEIAGEPLIPYPTDGAEAGYQLVLGQDGTSGEVNLFFDSEQVGSVPVQSPAAAAAVDGDS